MKAFAFYNIYLTSCYSVIIILLVIKHMQVQSTVEIISFYDNYIPLRLFYWTCLDTLMLAIYLTVFQLVN